MTSDDQTPRRRLPAAAVRELVGVALVLVGAIGAVVSAFWWCLPVGCLAVSVCAVLGGLGLASSRSEGS